MNSVSVVLILLMAAGCTESSLLSSTYHYFFPNKITYLLYTQKNPTTAQELITGDLQSVKESNFNPAIPTKIIIHGWTKSAQELPNPQLRSAYLAVGEYNLISVGWKEYASLKYSLSIKKVPAVGADVAKFVDFLNEAAGLSFESVVVIGHSLGAHVAGFAGKNVKRGRFPYIVGLDPAMPFYNYSKPEERLSSNDADYVETIQTNGGMNGFVEPIGSASFYPNWGRDQPGCGSDSYGSCSHDRSVFYYADAIRGLVFTPVRKCSDITDIKNKTGCNEIAPKVDIGDPTKLLIENGIFYLTTAAAEPFGHLP